jgi:hypothetical protein
MNDARLLRMAAWIALVLGAGFLLWTYRDAMQGAAAYIIAAVVLVALVVGNLPRLRK